MVVMGLRCCCYVVNTWLLYGCDGFDKIVMSFYVVTMGCYWLHCGCDLVAMWLQCGYNGL